MKDFDSDGFKRDANGTIFDATPEAMAKQWAGLQEWLKDGRRSNKLALTNFGSTSGKMKDYNSDATSIEDLFHG